MSYIGNKPANKAVVASDLDPAVITGQTALAVAPASTDDTRFDLTPAPIKKTSASTDDTRLKLLQTSFNPIKGAQAPYI